MDLSSSDSDFDDDLIIANTVITNNILIANHIISSESRTTSNNDSNKVQSGKKRKKSRKFCYREALKCLERDYLGPVPKFDMKEFQAMFRISRPRFQKLMQDVMKIPDNKYYSNNSWKRASLEAKLLLPIKVLAFGVANHCFNDYLQMSVTASRICIKQFHIMLKKLYEHEFLRLPTKNDIKSIVALHQDVHKISGMFGSLDCMHTYWKNCPKAWQGQFKGKEKMASIVLEGCCDYNTWFWHVSYGYAGTLNDLNILNLSPFLESLTDGTFADLEKDVVPYTIGNEQFDKLFILVDGIYPAYSRFVKPISQPVGEEQSKYTGWQESSRKDIERAFGNLQNCWHWVRYPIQQLYLKDISTRLASCIILHNMIVSDRIMGDVNATYDPSFQIGQDIANEEPTYDNLISVENNMNNNTTGMEGLNEVSRNLIANEWKSLTNVEENKRLYQAIYDLKMK